MRLQAALRVRLVALGALCVCLVVGGGLLACRSEGEPARPWVIALEQGACPMARRLTDDGTGDAAGSGSDGHASAELWCGWGPGHEMG